MLFSLGKLACWPLALGLLGSVSAKSKSKPCASNNYECIKTMCQIYYGWTTDSGTYLYGTNQWGWDDSGAQCMTVRLNSTRQLWSGTNDDYRSTLTMLMVMPHSTRLGRGKSGRFG